jgi:FixJ family two-component response regulator
MSAGLPAWDKASDFAARTPPVPSPPRISIIDDDASLREALVGLVRSVGYRGSGHGSAEAFLRSGETETADCLITDLQLPGLSGMDLALRLRQAPRAPPIIIIITARTETALLTRAAQTGALCVLRKPFAADALLSCLERALAAR